MKAETVHLNDIDMYYETEGEGDPLLLLHGGIGCPENWVHAGRDVFGREYTLIKPDARGHGRTNNPPKRRLHIGSAHWTRLASLMALASKNAAPLE
jgi:pimeloyl-ACP methyl ester carboxylesterase